MELFQKQIYTKRYWNERCRGISKANTPLLSTLFDHRANWGLFVFQCCYWLGVLKKRISIPTMKRNEGKKHLSEQRCDESGRNTNEVHWQLYGIHASGLKGDWIAAIRVEHSDANGMAILGKAATMWHASIIQWMTKPRQLNNRWKVDIKSEILNSKQRRIEVLATFILIVGRWSRTALSYCYPDWIYFQWRTQFPLHTISAMRSIVKLLRSDFWLYHKYYE